MEDNVPYNIGIPGIVLADKTITPYAKLLFGVISNLCNLKGFCFASSDYLAEQLGVTDRAIRNYIVELLNAGHIKVERTETNKRKIYLQTKYTIGQKPEKQIKIESEQTFRDTEHTFQTSGTNIPKERNERSNINSIENIKSNNVNNKEPKNKNELKKEPTFPNSELQEDPFFPKHDFDGAKFVHGILYENCKNKYQTAILSDPANCNAIYNLLISENKKEELEEKLLQYDYSWHAEHKIQPTPKHVLKSWDKLSSSNVPYYIREGFKTENECLSARRKKAEEKKEEAKPNIDWQALKKKEEERVKQVLAILGETQEMVNGTN